jgi:hypothetical protein
MDILSSVESMETQGDQKDQPCVTIRISDCGQLLGKDKMKEKDCDFVHTYKVKQEQD